MNRYHQHIRSPRLEETQYPAVRLAMEGFAAEQDDRELEQRLMLMFPESDPEDVENFMRSLRSIGRQIAPIARRALPGIVQGAAQGAAVGGPWGALIGAVGGGAMSALSSPSRSRPAQAPRRAPPAQQPRRMPSPSRPPPMMTAPPPPMAPPTAPPPMPAMTGAVGGSGPAAAQLLALLSRPETMQALQALLVGQAGRRNVQAGGRTVPTQTIANAIADLSAELSDAVNQESGDGMLIEAESFDHPPLRTRSEETEWLLHDMAAEDERAMIRETQRQEELEDYDYEYEEDYQ